MRRIINLLPENRKKIIKIKTFNRFVLKVGFVLILAVFLFIVFLGSNLFILDIYKKINQAEISGEEKNEIKKVIQGSKKEIDDKFSKSQKYMMSLNQRISYWDYFDQINQLLPKNIYLTKISAERETITIKGVSENRNSLVEFKDLLETVEFFKEIDMPISNFTSQTNVDFVITINLENR